MTKPTMSMAKLETHATKLTADEETLLSQLARYDEPFNATRVAFWAERDAELYEALRFLFSHAQKTKAWDWPRRLNMSTIDRIYKWLRRVQCRDHSTLKLHLAREEGGLHKIARYPAAERHLRKTSETQTAG
jgi:hypothetical protein